MDIEKLLFSRKESAHVLGLSVRSIAALNKTGALPVVRVGKRCLIHADVLKHFAEHGHSLGVRQF